MLFLINVNGNDHKFCKNCNIVCKIFVFKFLSNFILVLSISFVLQELLLYFIYFILLLINTTIYFYNNVNNT
jgi:hypothetical protein